MHIIDASWHVYIAIHYHTMSVANTQYTTWIKKNHVSHILTAYYILMFIVRLIMILLIAVQHLWLSIVNFYNVFLSVYSKCTINTCITKFNCSHCIEIKSITNHLLRACALHQSQSCVVCMSPTNNFQFRMNHLYT